MPEEETKTTAHSTPRSGGGGEKSGGQQNGRGERSRQGGRGRRKVVRREDRREFDQKILSIRRVSRVVAGGRRFSFSVSIAIGDHQGSVGVGVAKGADTAQAIEKAARLARKHMVKLSLTDEASIPHEVEGKYCASRVLMMPAPGRGLAAGSSVRTVLELAGVKNVTTKLLSRSKNRLNNAQAAMEALRKLAPAAAPKKNATAEVAVA